MTMTMAPALSTNVATVFVVEDDPAVRKSLRFLMESVGLNVQTFASAQEFLVAYNPRQPGCLVTDIRMHGMSGLELQERLLEKRIRLPVIVMTAFGEVAAAVRAMKNGAVYFFEKPINHQLLLEHIQASLTADAERLERELQQHKVVEHYRRLTAREAEVLDEVVGGFSSKEIGHRLGVSFKTVEAHRAKIMKKMDVDSVPQLIRKYLEVPEGERQSRREAD